MYSKDTLTPQMEQRVMKEMKKYNMRGDLIDRRYLYVPVTLPDTLQQSAEKAGKDPALILDLKDYPFRVPRITYLSCSADNIYTCRPIFYDIMRKVTNNDCICCSSFICPENWVCSNSLQEIIDEFLNIAELKKRIVEIYICNKVQQQILPDGLPIQDYAISQFL